MPMPAWILPAYVDFLPPGLLGAGLISLPPGRYPFPVLGPFAASLAAAQPVDAAVPIILGGLLFNGLGWMIAFLMFGLYVARLVSHELPAAPKRPGMFVAVWTRRKVLGLVATISPRGRGAL